MKNWIFDRFIRRISVRTRIILSFMLIMTLAGVIAPVVLVNLNSLAVQLSQVTNVDARIERLLLTASRRVAISQLNLNRYIQDLTPSPFEALDDTNQALRDLKEASSLATTPEQIQNLAIITRSLEVYRQGISDLQKADRESNQEEATRLVAQLQQLGSDINIRLDLMVKQNAQSVAARNQEVLSQAQQSLQFGVILFTLGFFAALFISVLISISISRPLQDLREGAERFQREQAISNISTAGADEFTVIAEIFNSLTRQISDLISSLENRVAIRTNELNKAVRYIERRAKQFEAIIRVSKSITASSKLQDLLPNITRVVSEQFGFYHVGIFLNDDNNQYAILVAANSEGGQRMLQRGHQLKIGEQGIVGYATSTGNARIALDVGQDVVYFNNPDLPETHSEMALPLKDGDKIIGALDIQSTESNAFSEEDIEILSALADQVSLAIQNARLFDKTSKTLAEADAIQRQYLRETWRRLPKEEKILGFRYSAIGALPIQSEEELSKKEIDRRKSEITIPIELRGETIGTLTVQSPQNTRFTADQMDLIRAVAERVALSAENARLFDETTRRAEQERIVSDISAKIGSSFQTESILQTAAKELSAILDDADIIIKLDPAEEEKTAADSKKFTL